MTPATPAEPAADDHSEQHVDPRVARSRARLLAAATAILVEAGPRAVTVDAVAERSGVSKSTLYRHWPSQQDLLVDVMRANVPDVDPPDPALAFEPALRTLVADLASALADPEWRAIMPAMMSLQHHLPDVAEVFHRDHHDKLSTLADVLARGATEGVIQAGVDTDLAAHLLIGPVVFAVLTGAGRLDEVVDEVVTRFLVAYRPA